MKRERNGKKRRIKISIALTQRHKLHFSKKLALTMTLIYEIVIELN